MVKALGSMTPDRKPSKALSIYTPLVLGVITALGVEPLCDCPWPTLLLIKTIAFVVGFVVWWLVVMAAYRGYHFFRRLFRHPR